MIGVLGENSKILLVIIVFLATYFGVISIHIVTSRQRNQILDRLSGLSRKQEKFKDVRKFELDAPFFERAIRPILSRLADKTKKLMPNEKAELLQRKLIMAGTPGNMSTNEFTMLQYVLAVTLAIPSILSLTAFGDLTQVQVVLLAILAAILGYMLPLAYL
ncbi:MAG: hypothetical protein SCK28_13210, partial [Bacillota bacterium]|nr:hypothetical protein [Bacillota bacterium]